MTLPDSIVTLSPTESCRVSRITRPSEPYQTLFFTGSAYTTPVSNSGLDTRD